MNQTKSAGDIIASEDAVTAVDNERNRTDAAIAAGLVPLRGHHYAIVMTILLALYITNFLDRLVVNILAEPIKRELALADWQVGLLTGLSFALFYTVLGIPIARLAERRSRPMIIGISAIVWSAFTFTCGYVQNFVQLLAARVGVGVGEAGLTPSAHSLIVDYAPTDKRSSALALYGLGAPLGTMAGMVFGGLIADHYGWRTAFLLAGAPGLLFALLALFALPEPRNVGDRRNADGDGAYASFRETLSLLFSRRSFRALLGAILLNSIAGYGCAPFIASFYLRNSPEQLTVFANSVSGAIGINLQSIGFLGLVLGGMFGICGMTGMYLGGRITDRLIRRRKHWLLTGSAIASTAAVPFWIAAIQTSDLGHSLILLGLHSLFVSAWYGPAYSAAYSIVSPQMRATTSAIVLFTVNLAGLGVGPLAVGATSDLFARAVGAGDGLRWALTIFGACGLAAAGIFAWGGRWLEREIVVEGPRNSES